MTSRDRNVPSDFWILFLLVLPTITSVTNLPLPPTVNAFAFLSGQSNGQSIRFLIGKQIARNNFNK